MEVDQIREIIDPDDRDNKTSSIETPDYIFFGDTGLATAIIFLKLLSSKKNKGTKRAGILDIMEKYINAIPIISTNKIYMYIFRYYSVDFKPAEKADINFNNYIENEKNAKNVKVSMSIGEQQINAYYIAWERQSSTPREAHKNIYIGMSLAHESTKSMYFKEPLFYTSLSGSAKLVSIFSGIGGGTGSSLSLLYLFSSPVYLAPMVPILHVFHLVFPDTSLALKAIYEYAIDYIREREDIEEDLLRELNAITFLDLIKDLLATAKLLEQLSVINRSVILLYDLNAISKLVYSLTYEDAEKLARYLEYLEDNTPNNTQNEQQIPRVWKRSLQGYQSKGHLNKIYSICDLLMLFCDSFIRYAMIPNYKEFEEIFEPDNQIIVPGAIEEDVNVPTLGFCRIGVIQSTNLESDRWRRDVLWFSLNEKLEKLIENRNPKKIYIMLLGENTEASSLRLGGIEYRIKLTNDYIFENKVFRDKTVINDKTLILEYVFIDNTDEIIDIIEKYIQEYLKDIKIDKRGVKGRLLRSFKGSIHWKMIAPELRSELIFSHLEKEKSGGRQILSRIYISRINSWLFENA